MNEVLVVKNLKKTFKLSPKQQKLENSPTNLKVAVNDLSFNAYKGEIYGLLGPNGAGKTTTLRILSTLIKSDSGDALIDGVSVVENPDLVRGKIGFLTNELKLENYFTPNYLFDFFASLHNIPKEKSDERKKELFEKFGIDKFAEVKVGELSTGMKQKAALAISIAHDPDLVIFDEPTNGLDIITAKTVTDFLLELKAEGKSIIISTHIFSLVEKICDRVGIIIDGKMVAEDTLENLCPNGKNLEDVFFSIYENCKGAQT